MMQRCIITRAIGTKNHPLMQNVFDSVIAHSDSVAQRKC
jgi:hypothetical protein